MGRRFACEKFHKLLDFRRDEEADDAGWEARRPPGRRARGALDRRPGGRLSRAVARPPIRHGALAPADRRLRRRRRRLLQHLSEAHDGPAAGRGASAAMTGGTAVPATTGGAGRWVRAMAVYAALSLAIIAA